MLAQLVYTNLPFIKLGWLALVWLLGTTLQIANRHAKRWLIVIILKQNYLTH
jgi:hypothetical protein